MPEIGNFTIFLFVCLVSLFRHTLSLFNVNVVFITYLCDITPTMCVLSSYIQRMSDCVK